MDKHLHFAEITDDKLIDQFVYLDRLVKTYSRFLNSWKPVEVKFEGKLFRIRLFQINRYGYEHTTDGEFDIAEVQKHITLYRNKIKEEFPKRNTNPKVLREKEIVKWEKYIKDAEVQM